jgi:hypothetical protein
MKSIKLIFFLTLAAFATLTISASANPSMPAADPPKLKDTCLVIGTVLKLERRLNAPYSSTPSIFNNSYQRLTVRLSEIQIHEKYRNKMESECDRFIIGEEAYFKLCSANQPRPGQMISGIAASIPANNNQEVCLFDVKNIGKNTLDK